MNIVNWIMWSDGEDAIDSGRTNGRCIAVAKYFGRMNSRKLSEEGRIAYWLELAEYDMASARVMLKGKMLLYVGFMCHQAVEKTLKACFVKAKQATPPFNHNLLAIAKDAQVYDLLDPEQQAFIDVLRPLNVECRYPTYREQLLKDLSPARCRKLIAETEELLLWLKKKC